MTRDFLMLSRLPVEPVTHPLQAEVSVPGSKSLTNRALLVAALAQGWTRLSNALFSDDSLYFAQALQVLGFDVQLDPDRCGVAVCGLGGQVPSAHAELFVGNAGTATRFLSAFLTLGRGEYVLDGDQRMRERPIGDLIEALAGLGATISSASGSPPVRIHASGLRGGKTRVAGDISSQFLSALLMVAPYAEEPVEITVIGRLNSRPYVDMTLSVMSDFGVEVKREDYDRFVIPAARYQAPETYAIEADASAASYFFAAPAICGGKVRVKGIRRASRQGDIAFLDVLQEMGCIVKEDGDSIEVTDTGSLRGVDVDMRDLSDTAQTLAVVAPFASSPTRIRGIASSRLKETDRVHAVCTELRRLGVRADEHPDGMTVHPCRVMQPAAICTYNDHRMAMAFALIGLRNPGVVIENPGCVSKTFPSFFQVLDTLR